MSKSVTSSAARYWHTLRHLKPVQIYGRAWHKLLRPKVETGLPPTRRLLNGPWTATSLHPSVMRGPNEFYFLNQAGHIEQESDWNDPNKAKLWLYNLHYFDDLNAVDNEARRNWHRTLIDRWIVENPPPTGIGWEPYPISLRVVNWIKWTLSGNSLEPTWLYSLAVQTRYLARRLEWHLLGNHLFANAKALVFAGLFLEGKEADRWLETGLAILVREIPEQILPDGGHFELSPMYHSIILVDLLDLINLSGAYSDRIATSIVESWREMVRRMLDWLAVMRHPDGQISFFNDAAFGIAPEPYVIKDYAERLRLACGNLPGEGVTQLKDSGYIRVQRGDMVALLDVARIGPDYIPGHAHADTLSFELSLFAERVVVNSGISQYGAGPQRQYERATAAHNTIEIDSENSSEVWGGFRVARRARPFGFGRSETPDKVTIECAHDGYQRLKGRVTHKRLWRCGERSLEITDTLAGRYRKAVARIHFHPEIGVTPVIKQDDGASCGELLSTEGKRVEWRLTGGDCRMVECDYFPEFGSARSSHCLVVDMTEPECTLTLNW